MTVIYLSYTGTGELEMVNRWAWFLCMALNKKIWFVTICSTVSSNCISHLLEVRYVFSNHSLQLEMYECGFPYIQLWMQLTIFMNWPVILLFHSSFFSIKCQKIIKTAHHKEPNDMYSNGLFKSKNSRKHIDCDKEKHHNFTKEGLVL